MAGANAVDSEKLKVLRGHRLGDLVTRRAPQHPVHVPLVLEQKRHVEDLEFGHEVGEWRVRRHGDVEAAGQYAFDHLRFVADLVIGEDLHRRRAVSQLFEARLHVLEPLVVRVHPAPRNDRPGR